MTHFPLFLNLRGRRVLLVGCGKVGRRKLVKLLAAGALVTVVDPVAHPSTDADWLMDEFREAQLEGMELAFACAAPDVNRRVVAECRRRGIWVNAASEPETGDFILPAVFEFDGLQIAVSTGGADPARARDVKEKLERFFRGE